MKKLILVRHGKSSWESFVRDFERPLIHKGIEDICLVAKNSFSILPTHFVIWSSAAKRASQTALLFAKNINYPIEKIIFKQELYTFDEQELETLIKSCPNNCDTLIVFGHNEAINNFVNKFGNIFIGHVPTSGLVLLQFDIDNWAAIKKGKTIKILFPKNLK
jgi:phosphohistidine phosphatase